MAQGLWPSREPFPANLESADSLQERKLFVGNLANMTTSEALSAHFVKYGPCEASVLMEKGTGQSRGFGFVTFSSKASAQAVMQVPQELHGKRLAIKSSKEHAHGSSMARDRLAQTVTPKVTWGEHVTASPAQVDWSMPTAPYAQVDWSMPKAQPAQVDWSALAAPPAQPEWGPEEWDNWKTEQRQLMMQNLWPIFQKRKQLLKQRLLSSLGGSTTAVPGVAPPELKAAAPGLAALLGGDGGSWGAAPGVQVPASGLRPY